MSSGSARGLYSEAFEKDACGIGLIASGREKPDHEVVAQALEILEKLAHRSAEGADGRTSDGAGVLLRIPHDLFAKELILPPPRQYAVGTLFLPKHFTEQDEEILLKLVTDLKLKLIGQRSVPVRSDVLGREARRLEPKIRHVFLINDGAENFDTALYKLRRLSEYHLRKYSGLRNPETNEVETQFYVSHLSRSTIVYKALARPAELGEYFPDLRDAEFKSDLALVHSRFSTNTVPAWELAQPFGHLCHNGEINTLRGNLRWAQSREASIVARIFGEGPRPPLLGAGMSDSRALNEMVEAMRITGRGVAESMAILIPEAWEKNADLRPSTKDFYRYHASLMEPWDGPAAVGFTDGEIIGARLDRNGLRPCRYDLLDDGTLILSSEAGVLPETETRVIERGRLGPGQMLQFDLRSKRQILNTDDIARAKPFGKFLTNERVVAACPTPAVATSLPLKRLGFTTEELRYVLLPMLKNGEEASSSMGNDTPLAILSDRPQLLFKYFRQMFAQVTNPPIDPVREAAVMSLTCILGARREFDAAKDDFKDRYWLSSPILSAATLDCLPTSRISLHFDGDLRSALTRLCELSEARVRGGETLLLLTDRFASRPISTLR